MGGSATTYWNGRYTDPDATNHHILQNLQLSRDLMTNIKNSPVMDEAFRSAHTILEVGCGTGDLSARIERSYGPRTLYATDFSRAAVNVAQKRYPRINFWVWDVLSDTFEDRIFDLAISSNTLEHFTEPLDVIDRIFEYARDVLIVVPYKQPLADGFDGEGGAGHVATFNKGTFSRYNVRSSVVFYSKGWQHSSKGESPRQLAVLLRKKKR